jgi:hypothetical protein
MNLSRNPNAQRHHLTAERHSSREHSLSDLLHLVLSLIHAQTVPEFVKGPLFTCVLADPARPFHSTFGTRGVRGCLDELLKRFSLLPTVRGSKDLFP